MADSPGTFAELVGLLTGIISLIIPVLFGLTLVVLLWKIITTWILSAGEPAKIEEGKQAVLIGIIALVVMSGVWGIVAILRWSIFGG